MNRGRSKPEPFGDHPNRQSRRHLTCTTFTCVGIDTARKVTKVPTLKVRALISKDDPRHSSSRTVEEVVEIFSKASAIWRQADIRFNATVLEWKFDHSTLDDLIRAAHQRRGDTDLLGEITGPEPRQLTAIYVPSIGGSNGKVFRQKRAFIVVDNTTVPDYRTTAHEIGHFFGLEHWLDHPPPEPPDRPPNQLMARTQTGMELIPRDIEQVKSRLPTSGLDLID